MTPEEKDLRLKALEDLSAWDQKLELDENYQKYGWNYGTLYLNGLKMVCTCGACPEQYDVYDANDKQVGYLRLRHGHFRADYPDCGGETVYESQTKGDGVFAEEERIPELTKAINALLDKIKTEESQT